MNKGSTRKNIWLRLQCILSSCLEGKRDSTRSIYYEIFLCFHLIQQSVVLRILIYAGYDYDLMVFFFFLFRQCNRTFELIMCHVITAISIFNWICWILMYMYFLIGIFIEHAGQKRLSSRKGIQLTFCACELLINLELHWS